MNGFKRILVCLLIACTTQVIGAEAEFVPGELIVKLKDGTSLRSLNFRSLGIEEVEEINVRFGQFLKIKTSESVRAMAVNLTSLPEVEYAEPNYIYKAIELPENPLQYMVPQDPKFNELWGLHNTGDNDPKGMSGVAGVDVDALRAWEITKGSRSVRIAVIDTGVDYNHPDLASNMWVNEAELNGEEGVDDDGNGFVDDIHGYDFANNDGDPIDGHSHGTHCAGTIAAAHDNNEGVAGVMAEAEIVAIKFLTDRGSGTTAAAIESIDYATSLNVDIMSNSWGGGGRSEALAEAISRAEEKGIYFVAAAGNSATNNDQIAHYPSSYENDNVIAVAAHNIGDNLASFSCWGHDSVDIAAPGRNIMSTTKEGGYQSYSGTSMATPHVSGVLGLLVANEGRISVAEMRERLLMTSEPASAYRRKSVSGGRVNAYNLLTDTRPERPEEPDPSAWVKVDLEEVFESAHPYANKEEFSQSFTIEGAKFIRAHIERYDIEKRYDNLFVLDANGGVVEAVTGKGENYSTDYLEGDTITLKFKSDITVFKWGFVIRSLEVIY